MSTFIKVKRSDIEDWLNEKYSGSWKCSLDIPGREVVYDIDSGTPGIVFKFYSSISSGVEVSRGIGKDAIRFVLFDNFAGKALGKTKRVHRTEGATTVFQRMEERLESLRQDIDFTFCPDCGHIMIRRDGKYGEFFGCSAYPSCTGTRNLRQTGMGLDKRMDLARIMGAASNGKSKEETKPSLRRRRSQTAPTAEVASIFTPDEVTDTVPVKTDREEVAMEFSDTNIFPLINYPFEKFQPIQTALAEEIMDPKWDENIVVSSPTGSGKTVICEMPIAKCIIAEAFGKGKKAIYASPFKALTQEKLDDWSKTFAGYNISIVTGDYTLTESRVEELRKADLILLTTEMLDSRTRRMEAEKNDWLLDVAVLVVDEFHIITMKDRGDKVESGLMRFTQINPGARIIGVSATMPNVEELCTWLTVLNGKPTRMLFSSWRPVQLNIHAVPYYGRRYWEKEDHKMQIALGLIDRYKEDKFLVFVHAKRQGYALMKALREKGITNDFHSADLDLEKRLEIEASFKNRENGIRVLVSTSTTAWGVNLPARRCIIFGVTRGLSSVDVMDIIQEIGRSGRPGLDPIGDAYIICPSEDDRDNELFPYYREGLSSLDFWGNIVDHCPDLKSQMLDLRVLGFHICAELGRKPMTLNQIKSWYKRSLAASQGMELPEELVQEVIDQLLGIGVIQYNQKWNNYTLTGLGRVSAWLYYDPWSIYGWYRNFHWYFKVEEKLSNVEKDEALAVSISCIEAFDIGYVPKDFEWDVSRLFNNINRAASLNGYSVDLPLIAGSGCTALAVTEILDKGEVANGLNPYYRGISYDISRIAQALKLIDGQHGHWGKQKWFDVMSLRIRYGVSVELIELVSIKGIGAKRAKRLAGKGIKSREDFLKNPKKAKEVLGLKTYKTAIASAREIDKEEKKS